MTGFRLDHGCTCNDLGDRRGADGIEVDDDEGTVRLPFDVAFDPGGIGKGLAADLVAASSSSSVPMACV